MTIGSAQLETVWTRLAAAGAGERRYISLRIEGAGALAVHAAMRTLDMAPCLLFDVANCGAIADLEFEVGGMRCTNSALGAEQNLILSLEDASRRDMFATICADVIGFAGAAPTNEMLRAVIARLEAWRQFLRSLGNGMERHSVVGLLGELLVLRMLVEIDPKLVGTWRAPDDGIHDFENAGHAFEVKTTIGSGSSITISALDQLDDAGLERLELVRVGLYETPQGESVDELIELISARLHDEAARRQFSNALLRRGLTPDDMRARSGLRAQLQRVVAWRVGQGFPRLLRANVPSAVREASYLLDTASLGPFASDWPDARAAYCERRVP